MFVLVVIALLIVGAVYGMGTDSIDRHTVKSLDINRYMGDWYEIARYDHPFERGLVEVKATYRMAADGRIEVVNCGIDYRTERSRVAHGRAKLTPIQGKLRVSFFWFFYSDYNVMELDRDYRWAVVGSRSNKHLWILARDPVLPGRTLNHILQLVERRGYRSGRLLFVEQQRRS
ncbi:MAG: lipocalin family protein [Alistipes sp.]|uniref:lipocalin family protein n=1 Tax=Alistipes sp. TaxID=1872444 RepID=UPI0025C4715C|nr:lipocalin family protein [Alistipes sp.]HJI19700.1 lipocalin family protein [Rikenellaceae bacterium]